MKTEKATQVRIRMGERTDEHLLGYLKDHPNKTIYELHKELKWSIGKVQKSLKRLGGKILVETEIEDGRIRKRFTKKKAL